MPFSLMPVYSCIFDFEYMFVGTIPSNFTLPLSLSLSLLSLLSFSHSLTHLLALSSARFQV